MLEPTKADGPSAGPFPARTIRALRIMAACVGLLLVAAAVMVDALRVGAAGFGRTQGLLGLVGVATLAVAALGSRARRVYVSGVVVAANTLLLLALTEVSAGSIRLVLREKPAVTDAQRHRRLESASYYANQPWAAGYWTEQRRVGGEQRYEAFSLWRSAPFAGKHITVGDDGFRVTPNADCRPGSYRVYVFGGSAAWGVGAPDWGTIPAVLQQRLSRGGRPVCVRNLAQSAFVSSQDLLELLRSLQRGDVPDLAVFYDGFNDVYAASIYREAGVHLNLDGIARRFDRKPGGDVARWVELLKNSQTYLLADQLRRSLGTNAPDPVARDRIGPPTDSLANAVVTAWLANYRAARSLAREYRFDIAFFWQPTLLASRKRLTSEERLMADAAAALGPLTRAVYERVEALAPTLAGFHFLGDVLDDQTTLAWIDFVHVTPDANRRIADRMIGLLPVN